MSEKVIRLMLSIVIGVVGYALLWKYGCWQLAFGVFLCFIDNNLDQSVK